MARRKADISDTEMVKSELECFLDGSLDPARFDHAAHVRMAKALLAQYDFLEAAHLYDQALAVITAKAGQDAKRSLTKTLAFLSLIAETGEAPTSDALSQWYSDARLADPAGRDRFLMPDRFRS